MTSVLRQLQAEWNAMVPAAQSRGIRRVRILGGGDLNRAPLETIAYRRAKVEWLRSLLGGTSLSTGVDAFGLGFGVEIECILPRTHTPQSVATLVDSEGVRCQFVPYSQAHVVFHDRWKVVTDGSLGDYSRGAEFVSPPIRGEEGFQQIMKVCAILTRIGARVNGRCGLHVHVHVGTEGVQFFKNLVNLYHSAQEAIDTFMPASRRGDENIFTRRIRVQKTRLDAAAIVDDVARAIGQTPGRANVRNSDRYCKLNLKAYFAYGTVEFRHHSGTVEGTKVNNWVRLCLRMVLAARAGEVVANTVDQLLDGVGADETEKMYFKGRVAYFARHETANRFTQYADQTRPRAGYIAGGR